MRSNGRSVTSSNREHQASMARSGSNAPVGGFSRTRSRLYSMEQNSVRLSWQVPLTKPDHAVMLAFKLIRSDLGDVGSNP